MGAGAAVRRIGTVAATSGRRRQKAIARLGVASMVLMHLDGMARERSVPFRSVRDRPQA